MPPPRFALARSSIIACCLLMFLLELSHSLTSCFFPHVLSAICVQVNNISQLATDLMLGLDSFMFFDDDPINIVSVSSMFPQVLAIRWPEDPSAQANVLDHLWAIDAVKAAEAPADDGKGSSVDAKRTEMYKDNLARNDFQETNKSLTFLDFIASLEITCVFESHPHRSSESITKPLARLGQMTRRTNRYNVYKHPMSDTQLTDWLSSGAAAANREALTVSVTDRFGLYGIVAAALTEVRGDTLVVSQFLMSCRVLNRGVEHTLLWKLADIAEMSGCSKLQVDWKRTEKNEVSLEFFTRVEALFSVDSKLTEAPEGAFVFDVSIAASLTLDEEYTFSNSLEAGAETEAKPEKLVAGPTTTSGGGSTLMEGFVKRNAMLLRIMNNLNTVEKIQASMSSGKAAPTRISALDASSPWRKVESVSDVAEILRAIAREVRNRPILYSQSLSTLFSYIFSFTSLCL